MRGEFIMAGSSIGKAWSASLLVHSLAAVALCGAWSVRNENRTMDVAAIYIETGDGPGPLPAIVAMPLIEPQTDITFSPIQPAVYTEPINDTPIPAPVVVPQIALPNREPPITNHQPPSTTFFSIPAQGTSIVYVVDCSASMGLHGRLTRALREVETSLRQLPIGTKFQVIAYHRAAEPLRLANHSGLLTIDSESVSMALSALHQLRAEGGADHRRALRAALALHPEVIYFLTDEDDLTLSHVAEVTRDNANRACIHAICLVTPTSHPSPMEDLARQNRGRFRVVE